MMIVVLVLVGIITLRAPRGARSVAQDAPSSPSPDSLFHGLTFTPDQSRILVAAGLAIQKGILPSQALPPDDLATFGAIERTLTEAVCPPRGSAETCARYRVDVPRCMDRAAEIVAWRQRARDAVDRDLFVAAMGVSVTGREFPTFTNLVRFCREMNALDPADAASPAPRAERG